MNVALLGREAATLESVATTLHTKSHVVEVDVTEAAATCRASDDVARHLGAPSVVIAPAGVAEGGPFESSDPEAWRRAIEVDLARSLRAEAAHTGAAVGVAYPHWTDTDVIRDADRHTVLRELRGHLPAGCTRWTGSRPGSPAGSTAAPLPPTRRRGSGSPRPDAPSSPSPSTCCHVGNCRVPRASPRSTRPVCSAAAVAARRRRSTVPPPARTATRRSGHEAPGPLGWRAPMFLRCPHRLSVWMTGMRGRS